MSENLILLVEDNDDDRELAVLAFRQAQVPHDLVALEDGKQALDYLFAEERYAAGKYWLMLNQSLPVHAR